MPATETREATGSSERERIVAALIEIAAERGYGETSIELILERAEVDRPAFDRPAREAHPTRGLDAPDGHQPAGPMVMVCVVV